MKQVKRVAVAAMSNEQGEWLMAQRRKGQSFAGLWEFPGGKIEPKESSREAVVRECQEELGIELGDLEFITQIAHEYQDFTAYIDLWQVKSFQGTPQGVEGQRLAWIGADQLLTLAVPPANQAMIPLLPTSDAKS